MSQDTCPYCGAPVARNDKWETQYACGTFYPVDGPHERGKECKRNEITENKQQRIG